MFSQSPKQKEKSDSEEGVNQSAPQPASSSRQIDALLSARPVSMPLPQGRSTSTKATKKGKNQNLAPYLATSVGVESLAQQMANIVTNGVQPPSVSSPILLDDSTPKKDIPPPIRADVRHFTGKIQTGFNVPFKGLPSSESETVTSVVCGKGGKNAR